MQAEIHYLLLTITSLSLVIWLFLWFGRGFFWQTNQQLTTPTDNLKQYPSICAVIPARNEAELLPQTLNSILNLDYPGSLSVILVDDRSTDGTAKIASEFAEKSVRKLQILTAEPLPVGWTGKLWAIEQGIRHAQQYIPNVDYFLLTDADIKHDRNNLHRLVTKAERENLDLVSLMVLLRCQSFWEQLLIPAFVFFFEKLYPFAWVNNPDRNTAAAAGGCILIRKQALEGIGGIDRIRQALIDDCALGRAVKQKNGRIWLGLTDTTVSLRPYPNLESIWQMVARTAYTQLKYSPLLLAGTIVGMTLIYLVPPVSLGLGIAMSNDSAYAYVDKTVAIVGLITWLLMSIAYLPTILFYKRSPLLAGCLPLIAFFYSLMTLDSARLHYQGKGGSWKGRVY
ncbi:MAG: glycosyltransferase [Xenococcaceae cyanobacterium]